MQVNPPSDALEDYADEVSAQPVPSVQLAGRRLSLFRSALLLLAAVKLSEKIWQVVANPCVETRPFREMALFKKIPYPLLSKRQKMTLVT